MQWLILLGVVSGMRTMTAVAVLCWFAWDGALPLVGTSWAFWTAKLVTVVIFTLLALGEYVGDVLPQTPSRTTLFPALSRLIFGGFAGAVAATVTLQPIAGGAILGAIGAAIGTWGGWWIRHWLAGKLRRDRPAGILESAFALALAIAVCVGVHFDALSAMRIELRMLH